MSKNTDTLEQTVITGTLTVKASEDTVVYGPGDIEMEGTLKSDFIASNTNLGNVSVISPLILENTKTILSNSNTFLPSSGSFGVFGDGVFSGRMYFGTGAGSLPSLTTRSTGSRIVLFANTTATTLDTGIGVDNNTNLWLTSSNNFQFFTGQNQSVLTISSSGLLIPTTTTPSAPSTGYVQLFVDQTDKKTKQIDSTGVVTTFGGGSSSSPLTTKGDIYTRNSTVDDRLPIGTPGQILMANNASSTGMLWTNYIGTQMDNVVENYSTSNTTIGTAFTDLQIDQFRTVTSAGYLNDATNIDTIINQPGVYLCVAKVTLTKTSGTAATGCTIKVQEDPTNSGTFTDVPGAIGYVLCNSTGNSVSDTCVISFARAYSSNARLKIVAAKTSGTTADTITQRVYGVNFSISDFMVDGYLDATRYAYVYSSGMSQVLTTTFSDVAVITSSYLDSPYTLINPSLTVNVSGVYFIMATVNFNKTTGTNNSLIAVQLIKNGTNVIGVVANGLSLNTTTGRGSVQIPVAVQLQAGDDIRIQAKIQSGTNLVVTDATLSSVYLSSTSSGQTNTDFLYMTSTTNTSLATSTTDLPFQTEVVKTGSAFIHSTVTNSNEVTVSEDGYYYIFSNLTYTNSTTTISNAQILTLYNNSISYNMFEGSYSEGICNLSTGSANTRTICTHNFVYLPAGFKIKIQGLRISTGGTLTTVGSQTSLLMFKGNPFGSLQDLKPFGTNFIPFQSNYTNTTTSTSFLPKGLFATGVIPTGLYKLEWQYKDVTTSLSGSHEVQILMYTPQGTAPQILLMRPPAQAATTNSPVYSGSVYIGLLQGNYTFEFDYRSTAGASIAIRELQMAFFRVK